MGAQSGPSEPGDLDTAGQPEPQLSQRAQQLMVELEQLHQQRELMTAEQGGETSPAEEDSATPEGTQ